MLGSAAAGSRPMAPYAGLKSAGQAPSCRCKACIGAFIAARGACGFPRSVTSLSTPPIVGT